MSKKITVFEYDECEYKDLEERYNFSIENKKNLKKHYKNKKPKIFRFLDDILKMTNQVGLVRIGDLSFEILPKIDKTGKFDAKYSKSIQSARTNLLFLLSYAFDLHHYENEIAMMDKTTADWIEILTKLYTKNLQEELKRGIYRNYISHEENLGVIKGKWLISQHIKINPLQKHQFYVQHDEFSPNTSLNQVLKQAAYQMRNQSMDVSNRQRLAILYDWMDEVTLSNPYNVLIDRVIFTRLNERFRPLFNLAKLFLENQVIETKVGNINSFAYTFNMEKLFEKFIVRFLKKHRERILKETGYERCEILEQAMGNRKYLATDDNKNNIFMLKPDIIFKNNDGTFPLIIDAKYKKLTDKDKKAGIKQEDMYQMAAYARVYECNKIILIYPQLDIKTPIQKRFNLAKSNTTIEVRTLNLKIDLFKERSRILNELNSIIIGKKYYNTKI